METPKVTRKSTKSSTTPVDASKKKSTKVVEQESNVTPSVVSTSTLVQSEAPKKKSTKVVDSTPSTNQTTDATSTAVGASTTVAVESTVETVDSHEELETLANEMIRMAKRLLESSRQARKDFNKQVKKAEQGSKRRSRKNDGETSHSNSVFLQPAKISAELASFCGVSSDTMLSRTEATRKIAAYIKEHDLQNPENRREIRADATLTKLFSLGAEDKLNYFNLQRYIKPHFIKE